tara:strand:- start:70 stop:390 length:321 start_codon:yes stop_codon:yes gene_type:complete
MEDKVKNICGEYPENFEKIDISSSPNYVFINDPNYGPVEVWDSDGNFVFVNSFIECEHYVSGGWDKTPLLDKETNLQSLLLAGVILVFVFFVFNKKYSIFRLSKND